MSQWKKQPLDHHVCTPAHDRPVFCLAMGQSTFVTGSADHGLRQYNVQNGKYIRQLFAKKYGHKQWVSTCSYTPDGHVLSGGMDSMVCYWDPKGVKCDHFQGHGGSISHVMGSQRVGISSSYDATIILWDLNRKTNTKKLLGPHKQAVMHFDWKNSLLVSGDKAGVMGIWDLNQGQIVRATKNHKGACVKTVIDQKNQLIYTIGLNDGTLTITDMRSNRGIFKQMLHKGATNDIKIIDGKVVTCSADHSLNILDLKTMQTLHHVNLGDMAFALQCVNGVAIAATSGGNIIATDIQTGKVLYGYGVMQKGQCRLLGISKDKRKLVCAGQDQAPVILTY